MRTALSVGFFLLLLVLGVYGWELIAAQRPLVGFSLGRPSIIWSILRTDTLSGVLPRHVTITLAGALLGASIGSASGAAVGLTVAASRRADRALGPLINTLSIIPLFAMGPLTVLWFGVGLGSKVFLAALATGFLAAALTYQHVRLTPAPMKELVFIATRRRSAVFWHVEAPHALLRLLTNARALLGAAVSGAIVGEFIGADRGVGHYILVAEGLFDVSRVWAGIASLACGAMIIGWGALWIEAFARQRL